MALRKILFWLHLAAGSIAGVVILVMSATGVLLAYRTQITAWVDRNERAVPPYAGAQPLPIGDVLARVCATQPITPSSVTVHSQTGSRVEVEFGRDSAAYFSPYTGEAIGIASRRTRAIFVTIEGWHHWLGASVANRPLARMITGVCNLAFLVLVTTGLFLWWPRSLSWPKLKAAATWRFGQAAGRGRDCNWHTVTGLWCSIPLLVIVTCGVVMSFPWANRLVYRMTGNVAPAPAREPAESSKASRKSSGIVDGETRRKSSTAGPGNAAVKSHDRNTAPAESPKNIHACADWDFEHVSAAWQIAERKVPGWQTISLRVPANDNALAVLNVDEGNGARPDNRSQLVVDWHTGAVVRWETFSEYNSGRQLRAWMRFAHTGEAGGLVGQTIAALAASGATVLVLTGLAMAWRRFHAHWFSGGAS